MLFGRDIFEGHGYVLKKVLLVGQGVGSFLNQAVPVPSSIVHKAVDLSRVPAS